MRKLTVTLSEKSERLLEEFFETDQTLGYILTGQNSVFLDCYKAFKEKKRLKK